MPKSSGTFNKRENEKKRIQKRKDKEQRREERKADNTSKSFESMIAYVDENGNFSSTPPDTTMKKIVKESDIDLSSRNKGGNDTMNGLRTGTVKNFNKEKGFGFIKDSQSQDEYFFHFTSANFQIAASDFVSFTVEHGPKGLAAVQITKTART